MGRSLRTPADKSEPSRVPRFVRRTQGWVLRKGRSPTLADPRPWRGEFGSLARLGMQPRPAGHSPPPNSSSATGLFRTP
eukprot:12592861-Alexandrium_andersonii.AAC.1